MGIYTILGMIISTDLSNISSPPQQQHNHELIYTPTYKEEEGEKAGQH